MVQEKKVQAVAEILEQIRGSKASVFVAYRGLTVAEANRLRARCREANVRYHVVKNRLAKRAFGEMGAIPPEDVLVGPTAVAFGVEEPTAPARVLTDFLKHTDHIAIKGGFLGTKWLDPTRVEQLSRIPGREVLLGRLLGSLKSPLQRLVWDLRSPVGQLAVALAAVAEQKTA